MVKTGFDGRRGHCALFAACIEEEEGASRVLPHCVVPTLSIMECSLVGLLEFNRCTALKIPLQHPIQTPLPKVLISLRFQCEVQAAQTNTTVSLLFHSLLIIPVSHVSLFVELLLWHRLTCSFTLILIQVLFTVSVWPLPSVCKTLALIPRLKT